MRFKLSGILQAAVVVVLLLWAVRACQNNAERADLYLSNWRASQDTTRDVTAELDTWKEKGQASERLAVQVEELVQDTAAASRAIRHREKQLSARTTFAARLRLERDSLAAALRESQSNPDSTTFEHDTAGVYASVTLRPGVRAGTRADLRLLFEPTEVVIAAMRGDGKASVLALTDSIHRAHFPEPPRLQAPKKRGRFSFGLSGPFVLHRTGWDWGVAGPITVRLP